MKPNEDHSEFQKQVNDKERRKLKAKMQKKQSVWSGFSVFGLIGWSVAVPTVLFVLIGIWLDEHYHSERSYTLVLLIAGLCLGCLNALYWLDKKITELQEEEEELKEEQNE